MGYQDAVLVDLTIRSTQYTIKMSPAGDELWLGISCSFTQWEPPNNRSAQTIHYDYDDSGNVDNGETNLRVHSWTRYEREWETFRTDFIRQIIAAWDDKLVMRHAGGASANAGTGTGSTSLPEIRCRLHAWEATSDARCKSLVCRAASRTSDRMAGRSRVELNMGGPRADCSVSPTARSILLEGQRDTRYGNFNMFLSSNDTKLNPTFGNQRQVYAAHEMGHFLGLWHRCEASPGVAGATDPSSEAQPAPATTEATQFAGYNPNAARDVGVAGGDGYCGNSTNQAAISDIMAMGMEINPWHGFAWLDALQRVSRAPDGRDYRRSTWTVERRGR